jgi:hypothetical protein
MRKFIMSAVAAAALALLAVPRPAEASWPNQVVHNYVDAGARGQVVYSEPGYTYAPGYTYSYPAGYVYSYPAYGNTYYPSYSYYPSYGYYGGPYVGIGFGGRGWWGGRGWGRGWRR